MKSFSLLRTQVGLTTNIKLVVSSNYGLFLDSIPSLPDLNLQTLKKFEITKDSSLEFAVSKFWRKFPSTLAYGIKYDDDVDLMFSTFDKQYDSIYYTGARNITENKNYTEEFEYFAPLHISKNNLPRYFVIFRVDEPGIIKITKENFDTEILQKMKCVKVFDLTRKTDLGLFLDKNINRNKDFPTRSLNIKFDDFYSSITGIKYPKNDTDGGYSEISFLMDFRYELPFYDLQKIIVDNFNKLGVIYPFIINFSFLFDDLPATPTSIRKWSINRYLGFYFDQMEEVVRISPTKLPELKTNVSIGEGNFLIGYEGDSPFTDTVLENLDRLHISVENMFYKVEIISEIGGFIKKESQINPSVTKDNYVRQIVKKYKIVSETSLVGKSITNNNISSIKFVSEGDVNRIKKFDDTPFEIDNFSDSDMWLINIQGEYFKLKFEDGFICVNSDHAFSQTDNSFIYYINSPDPEYKRTFQVSLKSIDTPLVFTIFRAQFTEIKDFDNDIIETEFSKFEYEKESELTITEESKLYVTDLETDSVDDFRFGDDVVYIPSSSEYTANHETFRIYNDGLMDFKLTNLWRKNCEFVKWGYEGSNSSNDYPYYLNNSILADPFNCTTNFVEVMPRRLEKNLDYFYSINSDGKEYIHHSIHVEKRSGSGVDLNFNFELEKYLGVSYSQDYFTYFFGKVNEFQNGNKNVDKWSYFLGGEYESNTTVFKGLKFALKSVSGVSNNGEVSTRNTNNFLGYKFSILLNENNHQVISNPSVANDGNIVKVINYLKWDLIEPWKTDKTYATGSFIIWDDIVFRAAFKNNPSVTDLPPYQVIFSGGPNSWELPNEIPMIYWYPTPAPLYNNLSEFFGFRSVVYRHGDYYFQNPYPGPLNGDTDFWNPYFVYLKGRCVIHRKFVWEATDKDDNYGIMPPSSLDEYYSLTDLQKSESFWKPHKYPKMVYFEDGYVTYGHLSWFLVLEKPNFYSQVLRVGGGSPNGEPFLPADFEDRFFEFKVVSHNGVVYGTTQSQSLFTPESDDQWIRIHSFEQSTDIIYGPSASSNNVVKMNNRNYFCLSNQPDISNPTDHIVNQTLDNGIVVYINKKHKNVLLNIYVNDNTMKRSRRDGLTWSFYSNSISNCNRDKLYSDVNTKLTANNILNVLSYKNKNLGFSDKLKYVIINEDDSLNFYDFNDFNSYRNIPFVLEPVYTNYLNVNDQFLHKHPVQVSTNVLKPTRTLLDGLITTKSTLNFYSDLALSTIIENNEIGLPNYKMYRLNGNYSPIFKRIQLFKSNTIDKSYDNFKFDTSLSDFGMTGELIVSKINKNGSILKLKNSDSPRSIYPMLDEFGYHIVKRNIFKSNWDLEYHFECVLPEVDQLNNDEKTLTFNQNEDDVT